MFRHETGFISRKPELFYQAWHPEQDCRGIVLIAHGMGGHGGQFLGPATHWAQSDLAVYAHDFRGHGRSDGPRGYLQRWADYLHDLTQSFLQCRQTYPELPVILWGHSLGGLIALDAVIQAPTSFSGLILSAPAVGKTGVSPFLFALGQVLSWVWPRFSRDLGFDPRACSRDSEIVRQYLADPLRHTRGTARLSTEFQKAQIRVLEELAEIQIPTLVMHGGGDRITNPKDSVRLYESLRMEDRQLIQYPHAYHELFLDINKDQVIRDMTRWIQQRC